LRFTVAATDPDGTNPVLTATNLPRGATFTVLSVIGGTATGRFDWTPDFSQAGTYNPRFSASDGTGSTTLSVIVTVLEAGNQAPVFTTPPVNQAVILPEVLSVRVVAKDPDSTIPALSVVGLPLNATFVDSGNGRGGFVFAPTASQVGTSYNVTFRATDGLLSTQVTVTYFVYDFIRGDANGDNVITSADIIYAVNFIFKGGPAPVPLLAADVNKDGTVNASDFIYLVNYIFKGGPPPPMAHTQVDVGEAAR
jgi:hypothetical protein